MVPFTTHNQPIYRVNRSGHADFFFILCTFSSYEVTWLIEKPKESDILSVQFMAFHVEYSEGCIFDNVKIYKGKPV
jgi:hypothetical protein